MHFEYQQSVRRKIEDHPHLVPLFGSTHCIPERLYEYNPDLFLCFNGKTDQFEIHSLANQGDSICGVLPYRHLDARAIRYVWENDIRIHGKNIFRRIEQGEEKQKKQKDREFKNWIEDVAKETQTMMAKDAWAMGT